MAPTYKEIAPLRNALAKFERKIEAIKEIEELMQAKAEYINLREEILDFINKHQLGLKVSFDTPDKVIRWEGGVGLSYGDNRSLELTEIIKKEIKAKKLILIEIANTVPEKPVVKINREFYFNGKVVDIGEDTHPYHLLDILITFGDHEGICSYRKILEEFERRKRKGELKSKKQNLDKSDITNARDELLSKIKINIKTVRGIGLRLHNNFA